MGGLFFPRIDRHSVFADRDGDVGILFACRAWLAGEVPDTEADNGNNECAYDEPERTIPGLRIGSHEVSPSDASGNARRVTRFPVLEVGHC